MAGEDKLRSSSDATEGKTSTSKKLVLEDVIDILSDDEIRRNREACVKFEWIVTKLMTEDLSDLSVSGVHVKRSGHVPGGYPGAEDLPHSTLSVILPEAQIYIKKTTDEKNGCCNFHVRVVENGQNTFDKEFTEFGSVISILDKISLMLSRYVGGSNRANELLGQYTGY